MFDSGPFETPGPWSPPLCGDPGPYAMYQPSGRRYRLVVLTCTRPNGHADGPHQYATAEKGPIAEWDATGRPVRPLAMKAEAR